MIWKLTALVFILGSFRFKSPFNRIRVVILDRNISNLVVLNKVYSILFEFKTFLN